MPLKHFRVFAHIRKIQDMQGALGQWSDAYKSGTHNIYCHVAVCDCCVAVC